MPPDNLCCDPSWISFAAVGEYELCGCDTCQHLGAATVALATISFDDLASHPDALSRVVQGIVQGVMIGIGFIGAGAILRDRKQHTVHGLTTAATVWVTAALGIACGLAAWPVVTVATIIAIVVLFVLRWVEERWHIID